MKQKKHQKHCLRNMIAATTLSFFIFHCLVLALYLLPQNPLSQAYLPSVNRYMQPFFAQNWNLFAPEPATFSLQFWYRCSNTPVNQEISWSSWQDPLAQLIAEHKENRFTFRGKLIYVYQNFTRNLLNTYVRLKYEEKKSDTDIAEFLPQTASFQLAKKFVSDLCSDEETQTQTVQFQVLKVFPKNFSQRKDLKPFSKVENYIFHPTAI